VDRGRREERGERREERGERREERINPLKEENKEEVEVKVAVPSSFWVETFGWG
jgi:hypothetical protein